MNTIQWHISKSNLLSFGHDSRLTARMAASVEVVVHGFTLFDILFGFAVHLLLISLCHCAIALHFLVSLGIWVNFFLIYHFDFLFLFIIVLLLGR